MLGSRLNCRCAPAFKQMKSKVYFIATHPSEAVESINGKLDRLLTASKVLDCIGPKSRAAIKVHFGEEGNANFVRPEHVRVVCDAVLRKGAAAFLSDANTLYRGRRMNSPDHLMLAQEHGFTKESTGIEIIIPDDTKKEETSDIPIDQKLIKTAKIARLFADADALIAVSHFKGHMLSGFGGAVKNIAMGCATREGKLAQHCDISPAANEGQCTGCGECLKICPANAIQIENGKSRINKSLCVGCASCIGVCPTSAMFVDMEAGGMMQEKMAEYAFAVLRGKESKSVFINFAVKISKECDCWGLENPMIAPDVGILASNDPVAIDKASSDLVVKACGNDIFKSTHPREDGLIQLRYAEKLGVGVLDYQLVEI